MNLKREIVLSSLIVLAWGTGPCVRSEKGTVLFSLNFDANLYMLDMDTHVIQKEKFATPDDITGAEFAYNDRRKLVAFREQVGDGIIAAYLHQFATGRTSIIYQNNTPWEEMWFSPTFHPGGDRLFLIGGSGIKQDTIYEYGISTKRWREVPLLNSEGMMLWQICFSRTGRLVALSPCESDGVLIGEFDGNKTVTRSLCESGFCKSSDLSSGRAG